MKTKIDVTIKTDKNSTGKTIYKENIDDLYQWCVDSKNFLIENLKNIGEELDSVQFSFPAIGARYFYQFAYYNSFSKLHINFINLTNKQIKTYFNQATIDYCDKIKQHITPVTLRAYLKQLVDQYGTQQYYENEYHFKIDSKKVFDFNYDGWSAVINKIQKIDDKYYLLVWWDDVNTDYDDVIDIDNIKVGDKETVIISKVYNKKFTFNTENLRNMIALILLNQKLGI